MRNDRLGIRQRAPFLRLKFKSTMRRIVFSLIVSQTNCAVACSDSWKKSTIVLPSDRDPSAWSPMS